MPCALSIDLDGLWVARAASGGGFERGRDPFFDGLPRFLDLLGELGLKATFFVIGRDLDDPERARLIRRAWAEGHELGNHTLTHPFFFSALAPRAKREEILGAQARIADAVGQRPYGFRAPAYDVDERTLALLGDAGYRYDASVLPTPLILGWRAVAAWSFHRRSPMVRCFGRLSHCLAPAEPYRPAAQRLWRRGGAAVLEVPISVTRYARLPRTSTLYLAAPGLFEVAASAAAPLHWTFHLRDLVDPDGDGLDAHIRRLPIVSQPLARKRERLTRLLSGLRQSYDVGSIRDLLDRCGPNVAAAGPAVDLGAAWS